VNLALVIWLLLVFALATAGSMVRTNAIRATIVSCLLVLTFAYARLYSRATLRVQLKNADVVSMTSSCRGLWVSAQQMASERVKEDGWIYLGSSAALAIIACAPRRRGAVVARE
jgi:hypothetical protein